MKKNLKKILIFAATIATVSQIACTKSPVETPTAANYKPILENIGKDVIVATYAEMHVQTTALQEALHVLKTTPNAANLLAAQQAWRNARRPWEESESFLFGPVEQQGIDPSIDSWPVNQTDLDAVLSDNATLNKTYIDGLAGTLKGFHTIEYLLFGNNSSKQVGDFTTRQFEYLSACGESLNSATEQLYFAWKPEKQNFVAKLIDAGDANNNTYFSQKAALQEIVNGMIQIADEVANGKINEPYSQLNLTLEESRFSANSKQDFADNIRSVKNLYLGVYKNTAGAGLSKLITEKNSALNTKTIAQINEAIAAIEAIEGTFSSAVFNAKPSVENAQQKVRALQQTLESEVAPIINNL